MDKYYAGKGCECMARSEGECGCNADWTPSEVYELRKRVAELEAEIKELSNAKTFNIEYSLR